LNSQSQPQQTQAHTIPRSYQSSKGENTNKDIQKILLIILVAALMCFLFLKYTNCIPSNFQNPFSYEFPQKFTQQPQSESLKNDLKKIDHLEYEEDRYSDPLFQEFEN
jgi:hypothetical protein